MYRKNKKTIKRNSNNLWFNSSNLYKHKSIILDDLHGYVLPHAGTKFTGNILSHTLRFKPRKYFDKVVIIYLPSSDKPNVSFKKKEYYHEYFVPWKAFSYYHSDKNIDYKGINILDMDGNYEQYDENTIYIVSADFSHFLPMEEAIELENKAAKSLMFRNFDLNEYNKIIDHINSFKYLYEIIPENFFLQWIGRSRSPGLKGVGYLSFLIRDKPKPSIRKPNGMFVTIYDQEMNTRECLGEWFNSTKPWSHRIEEDLIQKVKDSAGQGTRFTTDNNKNIPLSNYTITYLYRKKTKQMIRGWHGIKKDAFYLSDVFLENTHTNGNWIQPKDKYWKKGKFLLFETFKKLKEKAGGKSNSNYILYESSVIHI